MKPETQQRASLATVLMILTGAGMMSVASVAAGREVRVERRVAASASGAQQDAKGRILLVGTVGQSSAAGMRSAPGARSVSIEGGYWEVAVSSIAKVAALGALGLLGLLTAGLVFGRRLRRRAVPALALALALVALGSEAQAVPSIVNYQGRLLVDEEPLNGRGYFKFALLDARDKVLWTNDGVLPEALTYVAVELIDGHFSSDLGKEMSSLPVPTLSGTDLRLRIWIAVTEQEAKAGLFEQLEPDLTFSSVPYAFEAQSSLSARSVPSTGISGLISDSQVSDTLTASILVAGIYDNVFTFSNPENIFAGDGSGLTDVPVSIVPATAITGLISDSQVSDVLTASTLVSGTYDSEFTFSNVKNTFAGDGSGLTGVPISTSTVPADVITGAISDSQVSNTLTASDLVAVSAVVSNAEVDDALTLNGGTIENSAIGQSTPAAGQFTALVATGIISGDGSGLTNLPVHVGGRGPASTNVGFSVATVDSAGQVGEHPSITIGADGLGLISYYDGTNGDLKVAHCTNAACSSATTATLDSTGDVGQFTSITIGADDRGLISYYDVTNGDLKVAHCTNAACSSATTATVAGVGDFGTYTSITIGADGLGHVSYHDATQAALRVAHCNDLLCSAPTTPVTELDSIGTYTSITGGTDGLLVSFRGGDSDLIVRHCDGVPCSGGSVTTLDSTGNVGIYTSMTIGADGLGLISYVDFSFSTADLKVAHCDNPACTSATTATLDSSGDAGYFNSITIGADGLGLISYVDASGYVLTVAHCNNAACSSASTVTLDSAVTIFYTSITIGADGLGLISYYDVTNGDLKVAHLSNPFGVPYFRRR